MMIESFHKSSFTGITAIQYKDYKHGNAKAGAYLEKEMSA